MSIAAPENRSAAISASAPTPQTYAISRTETARNSSAKLMSAGCTRKSSGVRRLVTVCVHKELAGTGSVVLAAGSRIEARTLWLAARAAPRHFRPESERWVTRSQSSERPAMLAGKCSTSSPNAAFRRTRSWQSHRGAAMAPRCRSATRRLKVKAIDNYDFSDVDICLMSAGGAIVEGMVAEDRRRRRGGDRQLLGVAHGSRRAADRAGGERRCGRGLHQEEHHRQSELLDRAARRRAEAAA